MDLSPYSLKIIRNEYSFVMGLVDPNSPEGKLLFDPHAIDLLCNGFFRKNTENVETKDISSIIFNYIGLCNCNLQFKSIGPNFGNTHKPDLLLFKPDLSLLKPNNNVKLLIKYINSDCNSSTYYNGGYGLECGIIGLNKTNLDINQPIFEKNFTKLEYCSTSFCDIHDERYKLINGMIRITNNNVIKYIISDRGMTIQDNINYINNTDNKMFAKYWLLMHSMTNLRRYCSYITVDKRYSNKIYAFEEDINNNNDKTLNDSELGKENRLFINDRIVVCIECVDNIGSIEYYLYFGKQSENNDKMVVIGKDIKKDNFLNGKIKLDFDNYYYYFGMLSVQCGCVDARKEAKFCDGFRYEVTYKQSFV